MSQRIKLAGALAAGSAFVLTLLGVTATGAGATANGGPHPSPCTTGWYVNPDETDLMPKQQPGGLLFDGPSLVHHHPEAPTLLKDAATDGTFGAHVFVGVAPLFKIETLTPYSTINKTAGGYWSSKIASGAGSQSMPLASPADFSGKWLYTDATTVLSFGVGYAYDKGNKALVSWIFFGHHKYDVGLCYPSPSHSASSSPSTSASPTVSPTPTQPSAPPTTGSPIPGSPTPAPTDTTPGPGSTTFAPTPTSVAGAGGSGGIGTGGKLAQTGYDTSGLIWFGSALILGGSALALVAWRRRGARFTA